MSTILLIHGTADCAANWQRWNRWLARRGYDVLAIDLPGYGPNADASLDSSVTACCDALTALVTRHQPTTVLGHSLGANVAIELALRQVTPIERLLLVCPAVAMPAPTRWFYDWFVEQPLEALYQSRQWLAPLLAPMPRLKTANNTDPRVIRRTWHSLRDWSQPDWGQLRVPTFIAGGRWDHIAPPAALEMLCRQIPSATLTLLPARHLPMDTAALAFGRWLQKSLAFNL